MSSMSSSNILRSSASEDEVDVYSALDISSAADFSNLASAEDIAYLSSASDIASRAHRQSSRDAFGQPGARPRGAAPAPRRQPGLQPLRIQRKSPPRRRRLPLVPVVTTAALLILLLAIFLAAGIQGPLLHFFGAPVTTVTLTPRSRQVTQNLSLTAVSSTPDAARDQVLARIVSATSPTQSATASATGSIPAKRATGQLTFINNTANAIIIQSTVLVSSSSVQISFNGPISVPANPPTTIVPGFAVTAGTAGNIPTLDLSKACCAPNNEIFVKNTAFAGGQDAQPDSVITQGDIDGAAGGLEATLTGVARGDLQGQVRGNERVVPGSSHCQPAVNANHRANDVEKSVTVQVAETCGEQVYDYSAARGIALKAQQTRVAGDPGLGSGFALDGHLSLIILSAGPANADGSFTLNAQVQGFWVYSFSQDRLRQLAALIAGKSQADARALLLQQAGVAAAQFSDSGPLPVNTGEITVVIRKLPPP